MNAAELKRYQEHVLTVAKVQLMKRRRYYPMAFILARLMGVDQHVRARCVRVEDWAAMEDDGSTPMQLASFVVPLSYDDPATLVGYLKMLGQDPEASSAMFDRLLSLGHAAEVNAEKRILDLLNKHYGWDGKDIAARFLKEMCRRTEAIAIVKVDEVWHRTAHAAIGSSPEQIRAGIPASLAEDPLATEALMCSMETPEFVRALVQPFTRRKRDTGKVSGFGQAVEMVDDFAASDTELAGRFVGFLPGHAERSKGRKVTG